MAVETTQIVLSPYGNSNTKRPVSTGAEGTIFHPQRFDSGIGFTRIVDYMGSDESIIYWATMGRGLDVFEQKVTPLEVMHYNFTGGRVRPFRSFEMRRHTEGPISLGLYVVPYEDKSLNEYSLRYSEAEDKFAVWTQEFVRQNMPNVSPESIQRILELKKNNDDRSFETYKKFLDAGLSRELARMVLSHDVYTKFYEKSDLITELNFMREYDGADPTLNDYISATSNLLRQAVPIAMKAYEKIINGEMFDDKLTLDKRKLAKQLPDSPFGSSETKRLTVPAVEEHLHKPRRVLNSGFVRLVDYMGSDESIAQMARVSYGRGTKNTGEDDGLIKYLWKHLHTTPSEGVSLSWHEKMPMFAWRQANRHRTFDKTGVGNEYRPTDGFYVPDVDEVRRQSTTNRQGRGDALDTSSQQQIVDDIVKHFEFQSSTERELISLGVPDKFAERQLGVGAFGEFMYKTNLKNALHFLSLRDHSHAQKEVRVFATEMAEDVKKLVPVAYQAFKDYTVNAIAFDVADQRALTMILQGKPVKEALQEAGYMLQKKPEPNRAGAEFLDKARKILPNLKLD